MEVVEPRRRQNRVSCHHGNPAAILLKPGQTAWPMKRWSVAMRLGAHSSGPPLRWSKLKGWPLNVTDDAARSAGRRSGRLGPDAPGTRRRSERTTPRIPECNRSPERSWRPVGPGAEMAGAATAAGEDGPSFRILRQRHATHCSSAQPLRMVRGTKVLDCSSPATMSKPRLPNFTQRAYGRASPR